MIAGVTSRIPHTNTPPHTGMRTQTHTHTWTHCLKGVVLLIRRTGGNVTLDSKAPLVK